MNMFSDCTSVPELVYTALGTASVSKYGYEVIDVGTDFLERLEELAGMEFE